MVVEVWEKVFDEGSYCLLLSLFFASLDAFLVVLEVCVCSFELVFEFFVFLLEFVEVVFEAFVFLVFFVVVCLVVLISLFVSVFSQKCPPR